MTVDQVLKLLGALVAFVVVVECVLAIVDRNRRNRF